MYHPCLNNWYGLVDRNFGHARNFGHIGQPSLLLRSSLSTCLFMSFEDTLVTSIDISGMHEISGTSASPHFPCCLSLCTCFALVLIIDFAWLIENFGHARNFGHIGQTFSQSFVAVHLSLAINCKYLYLFWSKSRACTNFRICTKFRTPVYLTSFL